MRIRAGTDIAFLGGLINYILTHERWFKDYVLPYTNASTIIEEGFQDTEDLDGLFSGYDAETGFYDASRALGLRGLAQRTASAMPRDEHAGRPAGRRLHGESNRRGSTAMPRRRSPQPLRRAIRDDDEPSDSRATRPCSIPAA